MRALLDTHCWLWLQAAPERLGRDRIERFADPQTELFLSAASAWEIAIKAGLGKLSLPEPPQSYVPSRMESSGCRALSIEFDHVLGVASLPPLHRDPFDRVLVAQAQCERLVLVTADRQVAAYDVDVDLVR